MEENVHSVVVDCEEGGEGVELVGGPDFGGGVMGKGDFVALGEEEFTFWC